MSDSYVAHIRHPSVASHHSQLGSPPQSQASSRLSPSNFQDLGPTSLHTQHNQNLLNAKMKFSTLTLIASIGMVSAWGPSLSFSRVAQRAQGTTLRMAIDYNDPVVAQEFNNVQPLTWEEMEAELMESGVRPSPTMNDMEVKLMLVEMRLRLSGHIGGDGDAKKKPDSFSSKFEEATWTKPAFKEFYELLKTRGDHNSMNVVAEYVNEPDVARNRYEQSYGALLEQVDRALKASTVTSTTLEFSGFPANMGEAACKMTLESIGAIADFECVEDDDFPVLKGRVTFEDIASAKKAVEQYNGMDMGMGTALELNSV